jgi:dynein heavy chain, axonemal
VQIFCYEHKSVEKYSARFLAERGRSNHVTPTSYLELLALFRIILKTKQADLLIQIKRLENGLNKLDSANVQVKEMKVKIEELQPVLKAKSKQCNEAKEKIAADTEVATVLEEKVSADAKIVAKEAAAAKAIADDANKKVAQSNIVLANALK